MEIKIRNPIVQYYADGVVERIKFELDAKASDELKDSIPF